MACSHFAQVVLRGHTVPQWLDIVSYRTKCPTVVLRMPYDKITTLLWIQSLTELTF
jgi:hypothetical protein